MLEFPQCFDALKSYKQFIHWRKYKDGTKKPVSLKTGRVINPHEKSEWLDYETALTQSSDTLGVGFVLTKNDPFFFIDIDHGYDVKTDRWKPIVTELVTQFNGAAVEVSSSGQGIHIIGSGTCYDHRCKCDIPEQQVKIELYDHLRFIALTGFNAYGDASKNFTAILPRLIATYFTADQIRSQLDWSDTPRDDWDGHTDDDELLSHAIKSKSAAAAFGGKASFEDLWHANEAALSIAYPPNDSNKSAFDESIADMALAQHLAFWTGCNHERIRSLMLQSALVRDKWEREKYLPNTIISACNRQERVHVSSKKHEPIITGNEQSIRPQLITSSPFLTVDDQINLFAGCVYVEDSHQILIPGSVLVSPAQFKAIYGGYVFTLGVENSKTTTNAWEAFSEAQSFRKPRANTTCFRPHESPGAILEDEGRRSVNTWYPPAISRAHGDTSLFNTHINKLFPDERDREIFTSYLAAIAQHPGVKFRWCVLLQGIEGNGKTLFAKCAAAAVGRRYTHFADAVEINEKFNSWLYGNLLIVINEVYTSNRWELVEKLKTYISEEVQDIRAMRENRMSKEICCNFILSSNHKEAITRTVNDRRYATFYTPQQEFKDLKRDEMCDEYFAEIFRWLKYLNGFSYVTNYLLSYPIKKEFNPTHIARAPRTSSSDEAFAMSRDKVELEILEAIEQGIPGFKNGWVSSAALDNLLEHKRFSYRTSRIKRIEMLKQLGYDKHPGLIDGRVNNIVLPDGCKPRLYIKNDHPDRNIINAVDIARTYSNAQNN